MANFTERKTVLLKGGQGERGEAAESDTTLPEDGIIMFDGDTAPTGYEITDAPSPQEPNYNWYYNEAKTLVVREKISDGSFRWYFNNFDTTNAGRTGNTEYYVPPALRRFVLFDYGNETPPVKIDGTWYYYNITRGTNKASGGGATIGFEIRDGYTTPYIIAYHVEYIYKGPNNKAIIESTDFDGSAQYIPGGANSIIVRTSNHAWEEPTFDPYTG